MKMIPFETAKDFCKKYKKDKYVGEIKIIEVSKDFALKLGCEFEG